MPNKLAHSASAYLRSAMHQPVDWQAWGPEPFARARAEDKPILLDIGAVWCHWCHVMDRESYENAAIAAVVNRYFIAIKVDRDERPDVDARYQAAVQLMAGQGGWPLTALLTPDGSPFLGGTYFPPEDRQGRPGLRRVLETLAGVWRERRKELLQTAAQVVAAMHEGEGSAGAVAGHAGLRDAAGMRDAAAGGAASRLPGPGVVDALIGSTLAAFDRTHGGFGTEPKFPHPAALDLLMDVAARTGSAEARHAAMFTLGAMARGGVYDQLGGGFHRYSVDDRWVVPHFEKMLYDNAGLLANYAHAFQSFVEPEFARVTLDMLRWMDGTLSDRERGGFYASQDADIHFDDDGDYFTWKLDEVEAALGDSPEQLRLAVAYYNVRAQGDMQHNARKCVLHVTKMLSQVASAQNVTAEVAVEQLRQAHAKLLAARELRQAPFIDRTIYVGWNAMAVSAYLAAADALERPATRRFALRTLDRLLSEGWGSSELRLAHVIAYADGHTPARQAPGVLEDYALLLHAVLDGWQATAALRYYEAAEGLGRALVKRFLDAEQGGFFDTEQYDGTAGEVLGVLGVRRKPLQDAPTPAGNPCAAAGLLRLYALNGDEHLREIAEETLECFADVVEPFGLYAASYGLALERLLLDPVQVVIVQQDTPTPPGAGAGLAQQLYAVATARFAVNKSVLQLRRDQVTAEQLPPVLAETLPHLPQLREGSGSFAVVCRGASCLPPITDVEALVAALQGA
jgi:uncharacterized protein YyaL (SSP411 family)